MKYSTRLCVVLLTAIGTISISEIAVTQQTPVPTNFGGIVTNQLVAPVIGG